MLLITLLALSPPALAQEFSVLGGMMEDPNSRKNSVAWQLEYLDGLGEHLAATFSYLNEGHIPHHHRDGHTIQLWAVRQFLGDRIGLGLGGGLYFALDTYNGLRSDDVTNRVVSGIVTMSASYRFPPLGTHGSPETGSSPIMTGTPM